MKSLDEVAQEFGIWRSTRTKRAKIPAYLIDLVKPLYVRKNN